MMPDASAPPDRDAQTGLPKQRGKYAWNDFSAPPLPRSAAVATDTEWEKTTRANWQRMIAELGKEARANPAVLELVATVFGFASRQDAIDEGLAVGLAAKPAQTSEEQSFRLENTEDLT